MRNEKHNKYNEVFEHAVRLVVRHGRSTNTMPGLCTTLSRKFFQDIVRKGKARDKIGFIEEKIASYTQQIEDAVGTKRSWAERASNTEVVKKWKGVYELQENCISSHYKRKIKFADEEVESAHSRSNTM